MAIQGDIIGNWIAFLLIIAAYLLPGVYGALAVFWYVAKLRADRQAIEGSIRHARDCTEAPTEKRQTDSRIKEL